MADFPDIQLPSSREREYVREQIRTQFDDGRISGRSKFSKGRWRWTLEWALLNRADAEILRQHFDANAGDSFTCASEMLDSSADFTVSYANEKIVQKSTGVKDHFAVSIILEEV